MEKDGRKKTPEEEINERIQKLAGCYVPEWKYDRANPDAGSVIALITAGQMRDNRMRLQQMQEEYRRELAGMLGLSLLPAKPAGAVVLMKLSQDTAPGVYLPKGTKLLAQGGAEDGITFETAQGLYVTGARLETVFMVSGETGSVIPVLGSLWGLSELGRPEKSEAREPGPFSLFDFAKERGMERNALLLYHESLFDGCGQTISIHIEGGKRLLEGLVQKQYGLRYYSAEALLAVDWWSVEGEWLKLRLERPCTKIRTGQKEYSLLALEALQPQQTSVTVKDITITAEGEKQPPDFVYDGRRELDPESFAPFGSTIELYAECYIGHSSYFARPGAKISLELDLTYEERIVGISARQEEKELKIIRRRPPEAYGRPADAFVQEIALEYYNGRGWKPLTDDGNAVRLFAAGRAGHFTIDFMCPDDWQRADVTGDEERCIRLLVLRSDDCYIRPCLHHYPVIRDMRISYSYEGRMERPDRLAALMQTKAFDRTQQLGKGKEVVVFGPGRYPQNVLLLGFHRRFEDGPVSLLVELEGTAGLRGPKLGYEYSTAKGFRELKVLDGTHGFTESGILRFRPPEDMDVLELEGVTRCWIKIKQLEASAPAWKPCIRKIERNAVQVFNIDTQREESFYIEESAPGMVFSLKAQHILDADVWVEEAGELTREQREELKRSAPERIREECNDAGETESFLVRWEEVPHFAASGAQDRHYVLDRQENRICFGDGIHVRIPGNTDGVAFTVCVRSCNGREGNVRAGAIGDTVSGHLFTGELTNPAAACGGSSMESMPDALKRSAALLGSRNRLISANDYVQAAQSFSDEIHQAGCVPGSAMGLGNGDGALTLVILRRDFATGDGSFDRLKKGLREYLLERCELSVQEEMLEIVEPVFAEVAVEVWLEAGKTQEGLMISESVQEGLEQFLNPVSGGSGEGWKIGTMPCETQILMKINSVKQDAVLKKIAVTVSCRTESGSRSYSLKQFQANGLHVCKSGRHTVHILNKSAVGNRKI